MSASANAFIPTFGSAKFEFSGEMSIDAAEFKPQMNSM